MDKSAIDLQLQSRAHSILPSAPEHDWVAVGEMSYYHTGRIDRIWHCTGCPCEKRSTVK